MIMMSERHCVGGWLAEESDGSAWQQARGSDTTRLERALRMLVLQFQAFDTM